MKIFLISLKFKSLIFINKVLKKLKNPIVLYLYLLLTLSSILNVKNKYDIETIKKEVTFLKKEYSQKLSLNSKMNITKLFEKNENK